MEERPVIHTLEDAEQDEEQNENNGEQEDDPKGESDTRVGPTADQEGVEQVEGETRDDVRRVSEP